MYRASVQYTSVFQINSGDISRPAGWYEAKFLKYEQEKHFSQEILQMFFRKVVESLDLQKLYYICKTNTFRHLKTFKVQKMIRKHDQNFKIDIYIYIYI